MRQLVKLRQAGKGMIALIAEDIISVKEVDPTISMGATVKVSTLHSEYYLLQPLDEVCDIVNRALRDGTVSINLGESIRVKNPASAYHGLR